MTPREVEIAVLQADLADQGRLRDDRPVAEVIDLSRRRSQAIRQAAARARTEASHWTFRRLDGDDCA